MRSFAAVALGAALLSAGFAQTPENVVAELKPRAIGPSAMSGRISCLAVYEADPRIFYVGSASGGLWRTDNGGFTVTPVFEKEATISLGAVAVSSTNPDVVWVGTGEQTSRNSVAWGDGVYRSRDGGKTWTNVGLKSSRHIGSLWIDPKDDRHVVVGALGPLWSEGGERGLYETKDDGKTWRQILKPESQAGVIDFDVDPANPKHWLVSLWNRRRWAYDFVSGGPGSVMMRTRDAGRTWQRVTTGIPATTLGRIGVDFDRNDPKRVLATIEYKPLPSENRKPEQGVVKSKAGGTFLSLDGGGSWKKISDFNPRPFYFSTPRFDLLDKNHIWILGDAIYESKDLGKKVTEFDNPAHPDWHAWWQDPKNPNLIIAGNDGGLVVSRDGTKTWQHCEGLPVGQFYAVAFDTRRPYRVLGGLQDNQCWIQPTQTWDGGPNYGSSVNLGGGDGFFVAADPDDPNIVYSESQGGAAARTDLKTGRSKSIRPRLGSEKLRFNWSSPFILSPHNSETLYFGGNRLFKSVDRGDNWRVISPDLTTNDPEKQKVGQKSVTPEDTGAERHCTITTISESPLKPGMLYVGTDDGKVQASKDDGATWTDLTGKFPGLPAATWCSRVTASKHAENRAYATFDGHRNGDLAQYLYVTEDGGATWTRLTEGLGGDDSLYVIREGEKNPDLLYLGSEMALRVSLDRGKSWGRVTGGFPTVAVHDVVVHPKEMDLVIGTHGRSIWTLDVSGLEAITGPERAKGVVLAKPQDVLMLGKVESGNWGGTTPWQAPNTQPGTRIQYWLGADAKEVELTVSDIAGNSTPIRTATKKAGLNVVPFNGRVGGRLAAGSYKVTLKVDGKEFVTVLDVVDVGPLK